MMRNRLVGAVLFAAISLLGFCGGCNNLPPGYPYKIESKYPVDDPQFIRTMGHLMGPPMVGGNTVETLRNGDEIFPAMLKDIFAAKRSITFETFIYWEGKTGQQFTDALADRALDGVKV